MLLFMKGKIQVPFYKFPLMPKLIGHVIFRPFLGHLINRSHSPSYTINIFHNLLWFFEIHQQKYQLSLD